MTFRNRVRESFRILTGKQITPSYKLRDLANLVDYVQRNERSRYRANKFYNYKDGNTGRLREDWGISSDLPYNEIKPKLSILIARSRELFKNDETYKGAINNIVTKCIGTGLWPKPKVKKKDGTLDKETNKILEDGFDIYSKREQWNARKKFAFIGEGQRLILKTIIMSGNNILNAVRGNESNYLPISWQLCEVDRLDTGSDYLIRNTNYSKNIKQTIHGINLDEYCAPVSYLFKGIDRPISASNIIHSYMVDRPEQYIGIPAAVAALNLAYDKSELMEDYVLKSRAIAKVLWFLANENDDMPNSGDQDSDEVIGLDAMSQMRGEKAPEHIKMPDSVSETIEPLVKMLKIGICSCLGTSYTTVTRDLTGVNFAGAKFIDIQEWSFFKTLLDYFIDDACNPFYGKYVELMVHTNRVPTISPVEFEKEPYRFKEVSWLGVGKQDVEPKKEMDTDVAGKDNKFSTYGEILAKKGKSLDEHLDEMEEEREKFIERGFPDPYSGGQSKEKTDENQMTEEKITEFIDNYFQENFNNRR